MEKAIRHIDENAFSDPMMKYFMSIYLEFDYGGPMKDLSAWYYNTDDEFDENDAVLQDGYIDIIQELAKDVDIRTGVEVEQICYKPESPVEVKSALAGNFRASQVICTIPLGVLKQKQQSLFSPPLPDRKRQAISRLGIGNVVKVGLLFDKPFWPDSVHSFGIYSGGPRGKYPTFVNQLALNGRPMLETFALGEYALEIHTQSKDQIVSDVMEVLKCAFESEMEQCRSQLIKSYLSDWGSEDFSKGAYSFAGVGSKPRDFESFVDPVGGVLFFAGEHTDVDFRGTVHGAHLSGLRAANQVIKTQSRLT